MLRSAFLRRMAFAALAGGFLRRWEWAPSALDSPLDDLKEGPVVRHIDVIDAPRYAPFRDGPLAIDYQLGARAQRDTIDADILRAHMDRLGL